MTTTTVVVAFVIKSATLGALPLCLAFKSHRAALETTVAEDALVSLPDTLGAQPLTLAPLSLLNVLITTISVEIAFALPPDTAGVPIPTLASISPTVALPTTDAETV